MQARACADADRTSNAWMLSHVKLSFGSCDRSVSAEDCVRALFLSSSFAGAVVVDVFSTHGSVITP